ncbi:peptidoglycan DD-metalloendopeptidase family protein [Erysipelothrix sp. HDW6C]|uniref:M23 family metallopeptidase n=1 Tax=Erysipelothrix sp. HDW6C TaxID=2714930 RepID=UPI001407517B|nr:M23 family metallopeptidase [Erysipelothrix sp. HDW6C]QIK68922.1 peptidoglycan DD-metalloendopeptidase family protein [Erysipelothrix sp. HDW6C]
MKRNIQVIVGAIFISILLGVLIQGNKTSKSVVSAFEKVDTSTAMFPQRVETVSEQPIEITKLYREDKLIAIVHDKNRLSDLFDEVYEREYKQEFAGSKLGFIEDIYEVKEMSYNTYEDRDDDIFNYIYEEKLFAVETNKIEFSNGAIIYVKNLEDFDRARDDFTMNFVSTPEVYENLKAKNPIPPLTEYGQRETNLEVKESITRTRGFASKDKILNTEAEIQQFLSYGYDPKIETYEVEPYDTVDGIGWKSGMTGSQLVSVNRDKLSSRDQILEPGTTLKVSKFSSPLTVLVTRERKVQETVYPDEPIYQEDPELKEGVEVVDVVQQNGSRDVTYQDISVNTESLTSNEIRSVVQKEPIRAVIRYGTKIEPRIGSGEFRIPIGNGFISCAYGDSCYANHNGTDFVYYGNGGLGPILAADRGVVVTSVGGCFEGNFSCGSEWGNHVVIDHGNGFQTRYAHMASTPYVNVGDVVAQGEEIGYIGNTGRSYGAHLHFEIWTGGSRINPCSQLSC